uniref:VWFA domain-containing protein n=1 Tax=Meloidogyne javanica TaxID=6303 RepID=A0A915MHE4_MELJA
MRRGLKQMFYGNTNGGEVGIEYQQPPQPIRRPFGSAPPPLQQIQQTPPLQRPAGFLHKILRSGGVTVDLNNQQQQQPSPKQQPIPRPRKVLPQQQQQISYVHKQQPLECSIDGDYAELEQTWKQQRNVSAPLSPKTVKFGDHDLLKQQQALFAFPQQQQRSESNLGTPTKQWQRGIGGGGPQHSASSEEAGAALDEAARDLLRLSEEPRFRVPQQFISRQQQQTPINREISPDTVSATTGAATRGRRSTAPFAGLTRPASGQPWPQIPTMSEQFESGIVAGGGEGHRPGPENGKREEEENLIDGDEGPDHIFIHRHVEREHVLETEQKRPLPPVVKTTVEGKLKMEKSVGSHLIRCDHEIAKAYTVRDTLTHYRIRTIIGKRQLLIEEIQKTEIGEDGGKGPPTVRSSGTYRLSVFEDGKEIGTHEADIQLPENISKPDYLAKLSERLLSDLASLDDSKEQITAVTRVEIECIEDVTDIVKTYRIGLAAPKEEEQPAPVQLPTMLAPPVEEFAYESASDHLSELGPIELESRVYIDQLEPEELERRDIRLMQEGRLFEDKARIGIQHRAAEEMSEESIESAPKPPPEAAALVDCELQRREDRSLMEVYIAVPLLQHLTIILRLHKAKRRRIQQQQMAAEESLELTETPILINAPPRIEVTTELPQQLLQALGTSFDYQLAGQHHEGRAFLRTQGRVYSEESSVSSYGATTTTEPKQGIYSMEMSGQLLEGMDRLRPMKRYESETSIDYEERAGGGITHVNMVRKEDKGSFELTIVCDNKWNIIPLPSLKAFERPKQLYEAMEFMKTIEKERIEEVARSEIIQKCSNNLIANFNTIAQQSSQITLFCALESDIRKRDFLTEKLNKAINIERIAPFFATEFISENVNLSLSIGASGRLLVAPDVFKILNERRESHGHQFNTIAQQISQLTQHVHLERKEYENSQFSVESRPIRLPRIDMIRQNIREFSIQDEHCSVLMEHRSVMGEQTTADWGYSVSGSELRFHWSAPPPGLEERHVPPLPPPLSPRAVSPLESVFVHQSTSTTIHESEKQRFAVSHFVALPTTQESDARLAESIKASATWVESLPEPQPVPSISTFEQQKKIAQRDIQVEGPPKRAKSIQLEQPWREDRTIQVIETIQKPQLLGAFIQTEQKEMIGKSTQMEEKPKKGQQSVQALPHPKQIRSVQTLKEEQIKYTQSEKPLIGEKTIGVELPSLGDKSIQENKEDASQTEEMIKKGGRTIGVNLPSLTARTTQAQRIEQQLMAIQTQEVPTGSKTVEVEQSKIELPKRRAQSVQSERTQKGAKSVQGWPEMSSKDLQSPRASTEERTIQTVEMPKTEVRAVQSEVEIRQIHSFQTRPEFRLKTSETDLTQLKEEETQSEITQITGRTVQSVQKEEQTKEIEAKPTLGGKEFQTEKEIVESRGTQMDRPKLQVQAVQSEKVLQTAGQTQVEEIVLGKCTIQAGPALGEKSVQMEVPEHITQEVQVKPTISSRLLQTPVIQQLEMSTQSEQTILEARGTQMDKTELKGREVQSEIVELFGRGTQSEGPQQSCQAIQASPWMEGRIAQTESPEQKHQAVQAEKPLLRTIKSESIPREIASKITSSEEIQLMPKSVGVRQEMSIGETQIEVPTKLMRTVSADELRKLTNEMYVQTLGTCQEDQGTMTIEEKKKVYKSWEGQVLEEQKEEQIVSINKYVATPVEIETEEVKICLGIETQVLGQMKGNEVDNEEFIKKRSDSGFTETSFLQSEYLKVNENIFEEKGIIEELNIPIYLERNSKDFASNEILEKKLENIEEYFEEEKNNNFNLLQISHPEESLKVSVMLLEHNQQLISPISERTIKIPEEKNKSSSSLDSVGINSEISEINSEEEELREQKQHSSPSLKIFGFDAKVFESEKDFVLRIKAVVTNEPKKVIDSQIKVEEWLTKYGDSQLFEEDEMNEKEEELLTEKDELEIFKKIMKSSRQSSITKEFSDEVKESPQEKAYLQLKEKLQEKVLLSSKAPIHELEEFSANLIGKEKWENATKLQKSASLSSVREFVETRSDSFISINQTTKDSEEFEIEIKERRRLEEKINTKEVGDLKIESQITLEHPNSEEKTDKKLKEKLQEKTFLSSKASIKELKEFSANFVGKEEWESTRKIQKSKKKRQLEEKVKTKEAGNFKIQSQMIFEHLNVLEKADLKLNEKLREKALLSSKASLHEKKEFSANLIGKEECESTKKLQKSARKEEWESTRKIQKSASEINISIKLKEFNETRFDSVISFNQRPKDSGKFEIKIKERRKLNEKINTKSAGDLKIQSQMTLEQPNSEETANMYLKEKLQEQIFLPSKASIHEKKDFTVDLIGKEEWESSTKIIKSASQSSIRFKGREFSHERASSVISFYQKQKDFEEFEINLEEKRQLKEIMNTKELQNNEIREGVFMEKLQGEEILSLILMEKRNEKDVLSTKVPIYEDEEFTTKLLEY